MLKEESLNMFSGADGDTVEVKGSGLLKKEKECDCTRRRL